MYKIFKKYFIAFFIKYYKKFNNEANNERKILKETFKIVKHNMFYFDTC